MIRQELLELGRAVIAFPIHLFRLAISLVTVTLTDPEMLAIVGGTVALGFVTSPLIALVAGLFVFGILRTWSEVFNRHTEQINFLARVIRDKDI